MPCPSRSRTRAERESTLQVRGVLSARSGAFTSAPLSITAIFTLDAARSTHSGHFADARVRPLPLPGDPWLVRLGQRRLVDRQRSPHDRPDDARRERPRAARSPAAARTRVEAVALGAASRATAAAAQSIRATTLTHGGYRLAFTRTSTLKRGMEPSV